jgi:hypothetical protein
MMRMVTIAPTNDNRRTILEVMKASLEDKQAINTISRVVHLRSSGIRVLYLKSSQQ